MSIQPATPVPQRADEAVKAVRIKPPPISTVRERMPDRWRCDVACQAVIRGVQDTNVSAQSYLSSGNGVGHIAVRIGRVLVYVEDRDSLTCAMAAWERAAELADTAFGPLFNSRRAEAAARIRRDGGHLPN